MRKIEVSRREFLKGVIVGSGGLALAGCSSSEDSESTVGDVSSEEVSSESTVGDVSSEEVSGVEDATRYSVGETVETDLVRFTLNDAALAVALVNGLTIGTGFNIDNDYFTPKEYNAEEDADNSFVASKGHCLAFFEFVAENLDRDYLTLDEGGDSTFPNDDEFVTVTVEGTTYTSADFEEKKYGWEIGDLDAGEDWSSTPVTNVLLGVGTRELYRGYADLPIEPEDLSISYEMTFYLPTVSGETEPFTFTINS